jgi:hypothetical protein
MAGQQGGYRQPANPAPVSGPGSLSQRTDGGAIDGMQPATQAPKYMPGLGYGKGGENMANQQAADLAGNPTPQMAAPAVPLSEPTMRPNEPITTGVDFGPGPGTEAIRVPNMAISPSHTIKLLAQNDPTGEMEMLYQALADKGF